MLFKILLVFVIELTRGLPPHLRIASYVALRLKATCFSGRQWIGRCRSHHRVHYDSLSEFSMLGESVFRRFTVCTSAVFSIMLKLWCPIRVVSDFPVN